MFRSSTIALCALLCLTSCGDDDAAQSSTSAFDSAIIRVEFEVDYEVGAQPYTFSLLTGGDTWNLFETNVEAVYSSLAPEISVPSSLDEMEALPADGVDNYSTQDIVAIAAEHRQLFDTATSRTFYVIFLDGYYAVDGVRDGQVIGVSLGSTGIIAMFKPVYDNQTGASIVEQTTLVHEFGHAVGLVNKGIPLTSEHLDRANGPHCLNPDCVMFWQNEGLNDILGFIARLIFDDTDVLFGQECLTDIAAVAE
jgi:hypothetical protein